MFRFCKNLLILKFVYFQSKQGEPYCMEVDDSENRTGNDRFEGYSVDLIKEIADLLEFKYQIKLVEDGVYGKRNERGEWNGMIKELIEGVSFFLVFYLEIFHFSIEIFHFLQKADMAIADLTITYEREAAVDFTMPFMSLGIGILYKRQKKEPPTLFSFMSPLAMDVWVYLMTSFLGVTLFLFFVARFSPYEWVNPHPCNKDPVELKNNFSMKNTLWFTIGCLMQQGCDIMPRSLSTRVLAASWWFFILILVSSYTANLAAFLTVERMVNPIESAEDLSKQTKIPYGCLKSGSTEAFFRSSNFSTYARMWSFMESYRPSVFVESNKKGVDRVEKGNYAFLMESTTIEYIVERKCDLFQVGSLLDSKGYGIATPPDSPYRSIVSDAILKLQEEGKLLMLKNRWWSGKGKCGGQKETQKVSVSASELGLANVGGVFVVLAAGSIIAIIICIGEFIWKMGNIPRSERVSFFGFPENFFSFQMIFSFYQEHIGIELLREIKYVICCYGNTRPIRKVYDWDPSRSLIIEPTLIGGVHNIAGSGGSGGVNNLGISHPGLQQQRQYSYPVGGGGGGDDEKNDYHLFGTK